MAFPLTIQILDLFGVAVFAITGALAAGRKSLDIFGVVVIALVTALGGGTLRDLVLGNTPVFWVDGTFYILVAGGAALVTFLVSRYRAVPRRALVIGDALGLAVFTVVGAQVALAHETTALIAVMMGTMTGVAGGMLRDLLTGEIPLILRQEVYATASLAGGTVFVLSTLYLPLAPWNAVLGITITFLLRLAAIRWQLSLPRWTGGPATR